MMRNIKWGILGTGNIANSFASDFAYSKGGTMVSVASRNLENALSFSQKYNIDNAYGSYDELFNDPDIDVIYIATPHNFHFQNSADAIIHGKAVLCEKPLTINPQECKKLIEIAKANNTYLMEAIWTYFLPPIIIAKKWIDDGRIGEVKLLKADFAFKTKFDPNSRLFNPEYAGGALLDIGIYPLALAWLVYEKMPADVTVLSKKAVTGVDQEETMILEYDNAAMANLTASLLYNLTNEALIIGENGYIKIPEFFKAASCSIYNNDGKLIEKYQNERESIGYNFEIDAVNQDLQNELRESTIVPLKTSLKLQEIMATIMSKF